MKKNSVWTLAFAILATILTVIVGGVVGDALNTTGSSAEEIGGALGGLLLMPHLGTIAGGALFAWIGHFMKAGWSTLTGAILIAVATIFNPFNFFLTVPIAIVGFVAFAKQKKQKELKQNAQ